MDGSMSQGCDLPLKGNDMLHLKLYDAATGEKIFDHLYQSLVESQITGSDVPQIVESFAKEKEMEKDMIAYDWKEL